MATKIKRCLYVGLGGSGMNSLLHTKKMFMDTYGEVPPMIGFLGIDTDGGAYKKSLLTKSGDEVHLDPNEQLPITVGKARPIYDTNKDDFSWISEENLYALTSMELGAGQIRTNGRFAFTVNYDAISRKLDTTLAKITDAKQTIDNDKYELLNASTEIHMVFSICGGTGCGTFINMAYLLRDKVPNCKLTGYAVLPDVFKHMSNSGMSRVAPNAYGAIVDLDYLMHMGIGSRPVKLDYIKGSYEIKDRPFNSVIFIDNKNERGDTYTHIDELSEMISLALVTSSGELSAAAASVSDNIEKNISEGTMDIENKKAWAAGMGVCEIIYRGQDLGDIYAIKAAKNVIERFFNSCQDANLIANNWIDSPNVNIRENNNYDHVIDFVCDKNPRYELTVNDFANPKTEVEQNLNANRIADKEINEKIETLTSRVRKELAVLVGDHINQECGVSTVSNVLEAIDAQVDIFLSEMSGEKEEFLSKEPMCRSALDTACIDLSEQDRKFFKKKKKIEDLAADVSDACRTLSICQLEIQRRTAAITIFNIIKGIIKEFEGKVKSIAMSLEAVNKSLTTKLAKLQNNVDKTTATFQIDLAQNSVNSVVVKSDEIQISEFVRGLRGDKILAFLDLSNEEIEEQIMRYTRRLHTAQTWRNTGIDEILDGLSEEEFDRVVKVAIEKASPLFRYDYRGHMPKEHPQDSIFVGVPNKATCRFCRDGYFQSLIKGNMDIDFSSIGGNDRVIVYHQLGVVPAYSIAAIDEYAKEYELCRVNCHYDAGLKTRMDREDFSIKPKKTTEEDLLDFWVRGFVFGLIKNEAGKYYFKSQEEGDPLDDFWVELASYRDDAFDEFKKHKSSILKEFVEYFDKQEQNKGAVAMKSLIEDVKENYYAKYSQINLSKDELKKKGFEKIADLVRSELTLVKEL